MIDKKTLIEEIKKHAIELEKSYDQECIFYAYLRNQINKENNEILKFVNAPSIFRLTFVSKKISKLTSSIKNQKKNIMWINSTLKKISESKPSQAVQEKIKSIWKKTKKAEQVVEKHTHEAKQINIKFLDGVQESEKTFSLPPALKEKGASITEHIKEILKEIAYWLKTLNRKVGVNERYIHSLIKETQRLEKEHPREFAGQAYAEVKNVLETEHKKMNSIILKSKQRLDSTQKEIEFKWGEYLINLSKVKKKVPKFEIPQEEITDMTTKVKGIPEKFKIKRSELKTLTNKTTNELLGEIPENFHEITPKIRALWKEVFKKEKEINMFIDGIRKDITKKIIELEKNIPKVITE